MNSYVLASTTQAPISAFQQHRASLPGNWLIATSPSDLDFAVRNARPRYVFFPHWSHIVPESILSATECVCFHMTDVPYGRGGSPLQNLIVRGHRETRLTSLRMVKEVDAGPIYRKEPLSLEGTAAEIFARAADLSIRMIKWIAEEEPEPVVQEGEPTFFKRRNPQQSVLPTDQNSAALLYDHIRMLDAPGYPHAFCTSGQWRIEFSKAKLAGDALEAQVVMRPITER